jgi:hypothetical protein
MSGIMTPAAASVPRDLSFAVIRGGREIGRHSLAFSAAGDGFDVRITVDIAVKLLGITVFRYSLRGTESWRGGEVSLLEAVTDDNGTPHRMRAERRDGALQITGSGTAPYTAPANALPATHWNLAEVEGAPWINPQDGKLLRPRAVARGETALPGGGGFAEQYDISGDATLSLWYGTGKRWVALSFTAKDGSIVRYQQG